MAEAEKKYRRLPGLGRGMIGIARLWLGNDHLLAVHSTGYSEDYKRFYYRDIQAVITRKTHSGNIWTLVFGIVTSIFVLRTVTVSGVAAIVFGSAGGFFLVCLLINWARGPTCVCHLRTAVQLERLPSLNRLRTARKAIQKIKAELAGAQGAIPPGELPERVQEMGQQYAGAKETATPSAATGFFSRTAPSLRSHPPRHYDGRAHLVLFSLCLADVPVTIVGLLLNSRWTDSLGAVLLGATTISAILALIRQRDSDMTAALKILPWIVLGCLGLSLISGTFYGLWLGIQGKGTIPPVLSARDDPVVFAMSVVSTLIALILGMVGLVLLRAFRLDTQATMPAASSASGESVDEM